MRVLAVAAGSDVVLLFEGTREMKLIFKAAFFGDVLNRNITAGQHHRGAVEADAAQALGRAETDFLFK